MNAGSHSPEPFWRRWIVTPVANQLFQGVTLQKISLAIAFGITIGVFPLLGTPTLLALVIGIPLKLNQPVLQIFRELTYPLHLATILLFIRGGESLFGVPHAALSLTTMVQQFGADPSRFMRDFGMLGVYAVVVWALIAPVAIALLYFGSLPVVAHLSNNLAKRSHAA